VPVLTSLWRPGGLIRVFDAHTYAQTPVIATGDVPSGIAIP
jgi:hypothetical protein